MTQALPTFTRLAADGGFFEGPRWRAGRWWVSDFYRQRVITVDPSGAQEVMARLPDRPSGLGWLPDGDLLIVSMDRRKLLRRCGRKITVHADLSGHVKHPINDLLVDAHGRAYVSGLGFDVLAGGPVRPTCLIRVDPDGAVVRAAEELMFPNGAVLTNDGRTLIIGETFAGRYTAFDVAADGALSHRRTWAQLGEPVIGGTIHDMLATLAFAPDGCAIDRGGRIWSADIAGRRCVLLEEGGRIADVLPAPDGLNFFACQIGGDDGNTLLICAAPDFDEASRRRCRDAQLLTTEIT